MASRSKKKKIQIMEQQDELNVSRKVLKKELPLELLAYIKVSIICLIVASYFIYSPLLIVFVGLYLITFKLTTITENTINKNVAKKNRIKLSRVDCFIAIVLIGIAFFGLFSTTFIKQKDSAIAGFYNSETGETTDFDFGQAESAMFWRSVEKAIISIGTLQTGERNMFEDKSGFGNMQVPEKIKDKLADKGMGTGGGYRKGKRPFNKKQNKLNASDLNIDYIGSAALSSVSTILIFSLCAASLLIIVLSFRKKIKFNNSMEEIITPAPIEILSDEHIQNILNFHY